VNTWLYAKRELKLYLRDPHGMFLSLLGPIILLVLYCLFLGEMQIGMMVEASPQLDRSQARAIIVAWVIAGLAMVSTLTAPTVVISALVGDRTSRRVDDFLVSPLTSRQMVGGAWLGVVAYSAVVVALVVGIGLIVMAALGVTLPTVGGLFKLAAALGLSLGAFSALHLLVGTVLQSEGAIGGINALYGSLAGFLAGAYVPPGVLGSATQNIVFAQPLGQSGLIIRDALASPSLESFALPAQVMIELRRTYGFDLVLGSQIRPIWIAWVGVALLGLVCAWWAIRRGRRIG
jgi:multidrug/hemolysin transport system permease protein